MQIAVFMTRNLTMNAPESKRGGRKKMNGVFHGVIPAPGSLRARG